MPVALRALGVVAISIIARAAAQTDAAPSTSAATTNTAAASSTITTAPSTASAAAAVSSSSADTGALSLWSDANSLLSQYEGSTSGVEGVNTLTWPSTVTLGGTTYIVHTGSTESTLPVHATSTGVGAAGVGASSTAGSAASATDAGNGGHGHDNGSGDDHKSGSKSGSGATIAIAIGVAVGAAALAVLALILCCLYRRKRRTGSFFLGRSASSVIHSDRESWPPESSYAPPMAMMGAGFGAAAEDDDRYARHRPLIPPPTAMHPAYLRHHDSDSTSQSNPFYTPPEDPQEGAYTQDLLDKELRGGTDPNRTGRDSAGSVIGDERPPTPFMPMDMMGFGGNAAAKHPALQSRNQEPNEASNPFSHPHDSEADEADDLVSPILAPAANTNRRSTPMVHYPSWSEMSEFDFTGDGAVAGRRSLRGMPSETSVDSGDGSGIWRKGGDSVVGRTELA